GDATLGNLITDNGIEVADANLDEQQLWQATDVGQRAAVVQFLAAKQPDFLPASLRGRSGPDAQSYLNWGAAAHPGQEPPPSWSAELQEAAKAARGQLDHFEAMFSAQQAVEVEGEDPSPPERD